MCRFSKFLKYIHFNSASQYLYKNRFSIIPIYNDSTTNRGNQFFGMFIPKCVNTIYLQLNINQLPISLSLRKYCQISVMIEKYWSWPLLWNNTYNKNFYLVRLAILKKTI